MPQTSNRLVLQVDRATMGGNYLQGINTINANSYMVNKLAVRIGTTKDGVFTQGKLLPGETLWVTFEKQGTSITKTMLLAEQEITQLTATAEVDDVTITDVPTERQYEYVLTLPQAIMKNAGTWDFSLELRHIASINVQNISDVKYRGEWDASTGATQITGTPSTGDFYVCTKDGQYNPDGTKTWQTYALGNYAVYTGTEWVKSVNLFAFDWTKTSSKNTPYNLVVQNSLSTAENNQEITNETAAAFYAMVEEWLTTADQSLTVCCVCQTMITSSTGKSITTNKSSIKEGEPVVGQLALYSNGVALVESVSTSDFTAVVKAYHYIKINDGTATQKEIYAPTTGGTSGNILASTGAQNAPTWRKLTINGSTMTSDKTIYAPTTGGKEGQVLFSGGSGQTPTWGDAPTGGGGSSADVGEIQICCVANKLLTSSSIIVQNTYIEKGTPIVGKYILCLNGIALITAIKNTYVEIDRVIQRGFYINGVVNYDDVTFYAPRTSGTSGYFLVSSGSGMPVWKDPMSLTAFGANMCMVGYENGDTGEFGVATFTIFGNYTGGEVYSIEQMYNVIYNSVGENRTVLANGIWGELPVLAVMVADGNFTVMTMDMQPHTIDVLGEESAYAYAMMETTSMSKTFDDSDNWNNEGGDVWE